jgi:PPOX class probable F420-dependent enzyme
MVSLDQFAELAGQEQGLAIVSTLRAAGTIQSSLVNVGVLAHPLTGEQVVGYVTYGPVKLNNLRARPQTTVAVRSGWQWLAVEGRADLIGPEDPREDVDPERLRLLLREVFTAAGGTHDNWDEYDAVMLREGRTAVFVRPERVYGSR